MGRIFENIDWIGLLLLIALTSFGLFTLLSIRQGLFVYQLGWLFLSIIVAIIVSKIDGVLIRYLSNYAYIISIILLIVTFFTPDIRGASRWIDFGPIHLQTSEIVKPFLLLFFATFMAKYSPRKLKHIPLHLVIFIIPFILVFKQPDFGSSLVYLSFWGAMLFAGGISFLFVGGLVFLGVVFFPVLWQVLAPFQKMRITTFLNPSFDPRGAGYNAFQAMITVGSGQLFGRGLGRGTQSHLKFLPEYHTDFIFATLIEELGFLGGLGLLALYGYFLWRLIKPFLRLHDYDDVVFFYTIGLFVMILTQIIINTGMNMGIIPITGITLPFVSYGGSSLLSIFTAVGILWSLKKSRVRTQEIAISA